MAHRLTAAERETLNAAEQILIEHFSTAGDVLMFSLHQGWSDLSICYFTPCGVQHGSVYPEDWTLAGKLTHCLQLRAEEEARKDQAKADRIDRLRKELADLTEQVSA